MGGLRCSPDNVTYSVWSRREEAETPNPCYWFVHRNDQMMGCGFNKVGTYDIEPLHRQRHTGAVGLLLHIQTAGVSSVGFL